MHRPLGGELIFYASASSPNGKEVLDKGLQWIQHILAVFMDIWKREADGSAQKDGNRQPIRRQWTLDMVQIRQLYYQSFI
jgi:hypothetical protein